jgi:transposase-like protein
MQETINDITVAEKNIKRRFTTKEERVSHVNTWKKSGVSMSKYCRQQGLRLSNFSAWVHACAKSTPKFKPVKVASAPEPHERNANVVEIIVDQRIKIRLPQVTNASLVINIAKGLMTCS